MNCNKIKKFTEGFASTALKSGTFGLDKYYAAGAAVAGDLFGRLERSKNKSSRNTSMPSIYTVFKDAAYDYRKEQEAWARAHPIVAFTASGMGAALSGGAALKSGKWLFGKAGAIAANEYNIYKEKRQLKRAYEAVKVNPFAGKSEDVLAVLKPNGQIYNVSRGAIAKDPFTGDIIVQGKELRKQTGSFGNYGLTKTVFKHNITPAELGRLPRILRNYNPINISRDRIVYRTYGYNGDTYRQVWGFRPDGSRRLITFFKEDVPGRTISGRRR